MRSTSQVSHSRMQDYGIFYIDACDNPDKYVGKQITFKAMVHKPKSYKANEFVPGRFAMTCCAEDVAFIGFKCYSDLAKHLKDRQWVTVTGTIDKEFIRSLRARTCDPCHEDRTGQTSRRRTCIFQLIKEN